MPTTARLLRYLPRHWFLVGLMVIAALYVLFVAMMLALTGIFTYVGIDYLGTWCSLRFAHANGAARELRGLQRDHLALPRL